MRRPDQANAATHTFPKHPMTADEKAAKVALVKRVCHELGEHFDAVQILCSYADGTGTEVIGQGAGNWYARQGMAREFCEKDTAREIAQQIKNVE